MIGAVSLILTMSGRFERIHGGLYRFSRHKHMIDYEVQGGAASEPTVVKSGEKSNKPSSSYAGLSKHRISCSARS